MRGEEQVHIFGYLLDANAQTHSMQSLSAHANCDEMIRFLSCQQKDSVKKIFLVHGEDKTKSAFREKLTTEGFKNVVIPTKNEVFELE